MQGSGNPIAPSSLFYILCLDVSSACHCHFSHCEGLLLALTRVFSVSAVHLKSLFLTYVTGQLVLLSKKPTIMHTCFLLLLVWIFTFLLPGFPSACLLFFFFPPSAFGFLPGLDSKVLLFCVFLCFSGTESSFFFFFTPYQPNFAFTPLLLIYSMVSTEQTPSKLLLLHCTEH